MEASEIDAIVAGRHRDAFSVLGPHENQIRAWLPHAQDAWVVTPTGSIEMLRVHPTGFFIAELESQPGLYRLRSGNYEFDDPYRFPPLLTPFELYLHGEGTNHESYRTLGAHLVECEGVAGVRFAVWAPNAGDGQRDRRFQSLGSHLASHAAARGGIWEIFIPGLGEGAQLQIFGAGAIRPGAAEMRPLRVSCRDRRPRPRPSSGAWAITPGTTRSGCEARATRDWLHEPVSIYEVHLESWMRGPENRSAHLSRTGATSWSNTPSAWATRISN